MSTGGLFKLITNDGKQDMMLMATSLLNQRLADVRAQRAGLGLDDTPTLLDIERTHILFTNAHFKPFAAVGFEYNVVSIQTGSIQFGAEISFNIPQFGDFFTDMAVAVTLNQPVKTDVSGTADSNKALMRWCAYPGERIFDQVKFEVNGNVLDDYYSYEVNFFREYNIPVNKITGWNRLVGQEEEEQGFVDQPSWVGSGINPANVVSRQQVKFLSGLQTPTATKSEQVQLFVPLLFWFNQDVRLAIPSVAIPQGSRYIRLKLTSAENLVGLVPRGTGTWAAPNATLDFTNVIKNVQLYVNNIFVNPEIHNIFIKRVGFTLIRVHRRQTFTTSNSSYELQCQQLKWPIEYIYAGMKMADYNSTTAALQSEHLDKWHTFNQVVPVTRRNAGWECKKVYLHVVGQVVNFDGSTTVSFNNNSGTVTNKLVLTAGTAGLTGITAEIYAGDIVTLVPTSPAAAAGKPLRVTVASVTAGTSSPDTAATITFEETVYDAQKVWGSAQASIALSGSDLVLDIYRSVSEPVSSTVWTFKPTIDQINIKAHGIDLYQYLPYQFYSSYLPYIFGGPNVNIPEDKGCHFVNFAMYPGTYQPSGHVNVSRAREFYFNYKSSVVGAVSVTSPSVVNQPLPSTNSNSGYLYLLASAINFLLISDGGAVLRYST